MILKQPLKAHQSVPVTLVIERAHTQRGTEAVNAAVSALGADAQGDVKRGRCRASQLTEYVMSVSTHRSVLPLVQW